jgi:hypothetical protein
MRRLPSLRGFQHRQFPILHPGQRQEPWQATVCTGIHQTEPCLALANAYKGTETGLGATEEFEKVGGVPGDTLGMVSSACLHGKSSHSRPAENRLIYQESLLPPSEMPSVLRVPSIPQRPTPASGRPLHTNTTSHRDRTPRYVIIFSDHGTTARGWPSRIPLFPAWRRQTVDLPSGAMTWADCAKRQIPGFPCTCPVRPFHSRILKHRHLSNLERTRFLAAILKLLPLDLLFVIPFIIC